MPDCENLRDRFGDVFRVTFDPAYSARNVPRDKLDPWMMQLPCRRGVIYPHGADRLAVEVDGRPKTAAALAALPGVVLHQDGNREKTFLFPVELFDQVAAIVQPRKRRRLCETGRAALQEAGAATRFPSRRPGALRAP